MQKNIRLGIEKSWPTRWKRSAKVRKDWRAETLVEGARYLEHYAQTGRRLDLKTGTSVESETRPFNPPYSRWQTGTGVLNLTIYGMGAILDYAESGMAGNLDARAALRAFAAVQLETYISLSRESESLQRFGSVARRCNLTPALFNALGILIGCDTEALRLAKLQIAAHRAQRHIDQAHYPIAHLLLRLFADYLGEAPLVLKGAARADPFCNSLFEIWREPDAGKLIEPCLAVLDLHTHLCKRPPSDKDVLHEFERLDFQFIPIEILLLFKLRQRLGLGNPTLDHPLMNTPLGQLPEEIPFDALATLPDNLIHRVRERMKLDGFDEDALLEQGLRLLTPELAPEPASKPAPQMSAIALAELSFGPQGALPALEREVAAELLSAAAELYSDHSSNDWLVPANEANRQVLAAAIAYNRRRNEEEGIENTLSEVTESGGELFIYDDWLMRFLAARLRSAPPSVAELVLVAQLLDMLAEDEFSEYEKKPGREDFSLPATAENKALLRAAIAQSRRKSRHESLKKIDAAQDFAQVFAVDVMRWLAGRCREMARAVR